MGPGSVSGKSSGAAAPDPRPPGHTSTDACPLAVSVAAGRSAHLLGLDRSLRAGDSVSREVVRGGLVLGLPLSHIIKPLRNGLN